jgi:hypothetical protein
MALTDETHEMRGPDGEPEGADRVAALRGAGVAADTARVGRVAVVLGLTAIMVVAAVLLVAGIRKNAQIDSLEAHPVPVDLIVTHCLGLMGGSGSNAAGYECTGTYTFDGRHYTEGVPGLVFHPTGTTVRGIVSASDPGLFSTAQTVADEHASPAKVVLPAVVLVMTLSGGVWLLVRARRRRAA